MPGEIVITHMEGGMPEWAVGKDKGRLSPVVFTVVGVPMGIDPTTIPGIPQEGHIRTFDGTAFVLRERRVIETIRDDQGSYEIECFYETPSWRGNQKDRTDTAFNDWTLDYAKRTVDYPFCFRQKYLKFPPGGGPEVEASKWVQRTREIPIEHEILNINVVVPVADDRAAKMAVIQAATAQNNKLHLFAGKFRLFLSPTLKETAIGRIEIAYTWESDPGNGGLGIPQGGVADDYVMAPARLPFHEYIVNPGPTPDASPTITAFDIFPLNAPGGGPNPYYVPNGHLNLPGRPI